MKKEKQIIKMWAVKQQNFPIIADDIFDRKREAEIYKRDCFEPRHKAKVVPVEIKILT